MLCYRVLKPQKKLHFIYNRKNGINLGCVYPAGDPTAALVSILCQQIFLVKRRFENVNMAASIFMLACSTQS